MRPQRVISRQETFRIATDKFELELRRRYPGATRQSIRSLARKAVRETMKKMPGRVVQESKPTNFFERIKEFLHLGQVRYTN